MQHVRNKAWLTYLCIAGFWMFYPIAFVLVFLEVYCGINIKVNQIIELFMIFSGIPLGTYGIARTDWDLLSKVVVWIVCVIAVIGCLIPFSFLVIYCFGVQAT